MVGVAELGMAGAPDTTVMALAQREERVLVTLDADFANLRRFPPAGTPGIVRLKVHPAIDLFGVQQLAAATRDHSADPAFPTARWQFSRSGKGQYSHPARMSEVWRDATSVIQARPRRTRPGGFGR